MCCIAPSAGIPELVAITKLPSPFDVKSTCLFSAYLLIKLNALSPASGAAMSSAPLNKGGATSSITAISVLI